MQASVHLNTNPGKIIIILEIKHMRWEHREETSNCDGEYWEHLHSWGKADFNFSGRQMEGLRKACG